MVQQSLPLEVKNAIGRSLFWCEDVVYGLLGVLLVAVAAVVVYSAAVSFLHVFSHESIVEGVVGKSTTYCLV